MKMDEVSHPRVQRARFPSLTFGYFWRRVGLLTFGQMLTLDAPGSYAPGGLRAAAVRFLLENLHFPFKNVDFPLKNVDFIIKQRRGCHRRAALEQKMMFHHE